MRLTKAELEEWQAALRDPKRKQITGLLHTSHGQCCLGVFCELHAPRLGLKVLKHGSGDVSYGTERLALPGPVMFQFNSRRNGPVIPIWFMTREEQDRFSGTHSARHVTPTGPGVYVSKLNDAGFSFERIAELLPYGVTIVESHDAPYKEPDEYLA